MRMTVRTEQLLQDGGAPEYVYHNRTASRCAVFVGKRYGSRISTKKCCPCTVSIACHVKQSIIWRISTRKGGHRISTGQHRVGRPVEMATSATLQRVEDIIRADRRVTIDVWRWRWKMNIYLSLSPFVSFQSRFVTYSLTFPRNYIAYLQYKESFQTQNPLYQSALALLTKRYVIQSIYIKKQTGFPKPTKASLSMQSVSLRKSARSSVKYPVLWN
jgi:hypothetical protein